MLEEGSKPSRSAVATRNPARVTGNGQQSSDYLQARWLPWIPRTGAVRVLVGGRDFLQSRFNRAMQARRRLVRRSAVSCMPPRSEQGYSAASLITNLSDYPTLTPQGELGCRRTSTRPPMR
jgi:hypothetical protein